MRDHSTLPTRIRHRNGTIVTIPVMMRCWVSWATGSTSSDPAAGASTRRLTAAQSTRGRKFAASGALSLPSDFGQGPRAAGRHHGAMTIGGALLVLAVGLRLRYAVPVSVAGVHLQ